MKPGQIRVTASAGSEESRGTAVGQIADIATTDKMRFEVLQRDGTWLPLRGVCYGSKVEPFDTTDPIRMSIVVELSELSIIGSSEGGDDGEVAA